MVRLKQNSETAATPHAERGGTHRAIGWLRWLLLGRAKSQAPIGNPVGREGEKVAARFLRRLGYRVLAHSVRMKVGEADLVCLDPDGRTIVVVEVKSRRYEEGVSAGGRAVAPEAAVTAHKQRKLAAVARALARSNGWKDRPMRIDVVAVDFEASQRRPAIRHYQHAVHAARP